MVCLFGIYMVMMFFSVVVDKVDIVVVWDVLVWLESDDFICVFVVLLLQGVVWGLFDGEVILFDSWYVCFVCVLLYFFLDFYVCLWMLVCEGVVLQFDFFLDLWEVDYGLFDECMVGNGLWVECLCVLFVKVVFVVVLMFGDFILLVSQYGFMIMIIELCLFECGFFVCGGEYECGNLRFEEIYWEVSIFDGVVDYFICGESEFGYDWFFDFGESVFLFCMLWWFVFGWIFLIFV